MAVKIKKNSESDNGSQKPAFEEVLAQAQALAKTSGPSAISEALKSAATAELDPVAEEMILNTIQSKTKLNKKPLRQRIGMLRQELGLQPNDLGLAIARKVRIEHFQQGANILRSFDGSYWTFTSTHWQPITDDYIKQLLLKTANEMGAPPGGKSLAALMGEGKRCFDALMSTDEDVMGLTADPPPIVNCANGELWIEPDGTVSLLPHKPESQLMYCLPIEYDPDAKCQKFDKTLSEIFGQSSDAMDMVRHWHEFVGYAIQPQRNIATYWLLIGHGSNGKTKLLQTVQRLMGAEAVLNDQISTFQRDRFNIAALASKLMLVDDDISEDTTLDDGLLKKMSEAKEISARHVYGRRKFNFICRALPVMAGNCYPRTTDISLGMVRRAQVIPFDRVFTPDKAKPALFSSIWEQEMPGILNQALEGLKRLRQRGNFKLPKDCVRAAQEFFNHANPLSGFIADRCVEDEKGRTLVSDMRSAMRLWAADQGVKRPPADNTLKRKFQGLGYKVSTVKGYPTVFGLSLKQ